MEKPIIEIFPIGGHVETRKDWVHNDPACRCCGRNYIEKIQDEDGTKYIHSRYITSKEPTSWCQYPSQPGEPFWYTALLAGGLECNSIYFPNIER